MKNSFIIILILIFAQISNAQKVLTLPEVIRLAQDSSLTAFRYKNMYMSSYWQWRNYKADRLPSLTLQLTPVAYNRQLISRYDSESDMDVYRQQKSYLANGNLILSQNFTPLGGTFTINTSLD